MVKIFFLTDPEFDAYNYQKNPLEGSLTIYVSLEDKYGHFYAPRYVASLVVKQFEGATLWQSTGLWKGKLEEGLVIHIVNDTENLTWKNFKKKGLELVKKLKKELKQKSILYELIPPALTKYKLI